MYPQEESAAGGPRRTLVEEAHANWLETSICVLDVYGRLRMAPRAGCQFHRKFLRNKSSRLRMSWIPPAIPHARTRTGFSGLCASRATRWEIAN